MPTGNIGRARDGNTGQFPSVYGELVKIFEETVEALRKSAEAKGLDASGVLLASIKFEPKRLGDILRFQLTMADYYQWVDEGRKPGKFPPLKAILEWMRFKGIVPRNARGKKINNERARRGLAYVIARSIARKGTIKRFGHKGSNFYTEVIPSEKVFVDKVVKRLSIAAKQDILVELKYYDK